MRYSVTKRGAIAVRGHPRPTLEEALALAEEMLADAGDGEVVTVTDNQTGERYQGADDIRRLRLALEAERDA
jgi:hypothetical protein